MGTRIAPGWWVLVSAMMACGDSGSSAGGAAAGGSSADGGAGGAAASGGNSSGGAGGAAPLRCPDICEAFAAVFESYACAFDQCNCKEPCADLHQAAIDCIVENDPVCECNAASELDCDDTCDAENMAANACFSAN